MNVSPSAASRNDDDQSLAQQARDGNRQAFGLLVARHHVAVRTLLWRVIGRGDEVDDLAQEVFLAALRSIRGFRLESSFRTWLLSIARNQAISHLRSRQASRKVEVDHVEQLFDQLHAAALLDEQLTDNHEDALKNCIEQLEPSQRTLIHQAYFEGRAPTDMARQMQIPAGTIRMRLMRIRKALAGCLQRHATK